MRIRYWIIFALCLNAALAVVARRQWIGRPTVVAQSDSPAAAISEIRKPSVVTPMPMTNVVDEAVHWSRIESEDYLTYIANLRAIGCPRETIRDIITADVNELYDRKVKDLVEPVSARFWELLLDKKRFEEVVEEKAKELRAMRDERDQLLETLLGADDVPPGRIEEARLDQSRERLSFLSDEQVAPVKAIETECDVELRNIHERNASGAISAEAAGRLRDEAAARMHEKLKALLTPDEFLEYRLRSNHAALAVRSSLADLDVSEHEVRKIAGVQPGSNSLTEIRAILGEERYAAYQRAQDQIYRQTLAVVDRFDLPSETAGQLYEMQKAAMEQAKAIRSDHSRSEEDRQALLTAIQEETERSLAARLDPKVFRAYRRNAGDWIQFLDDLQTPR